MQVGHTTAVTSVHMGRVVWGHRDTNMLPRARARLHTLPFSYFLQLGLEGSSWLKACVHTCMRFFFNLFMYILFPFTIHNGRIQQADSSTRCTSLITHGVITRLSAVTTACLGHLTSTSRCVNLATTAKKTLHAILATSKLSAQKRWKKCFFCYKNAEIWDQRR